MTTEHNPAAEAYVKSMSQDPEAKIADAIESVGDLLKVERNRWIACCAACTILALGAGFLTGHVEASPSTPHEAQIVLDRLTAEENTRHSEAMHGASAGVGK